MPPTFFDLLRHAGSAVGVIYQLAQLVAKLRKERAYNQNDVLLINAARRMYAETFPTGLIPIELRYLHEGLEDDVKTEAPEGGTYYPPLTLKEEYVLLPEDFGTNEVAHLCMDAVSDIQEYLNQLNKLAGGRVNKYTNFVHYGKSHDSVRFLIHLITNGFLVLSRMDVHDKDMYEKAESYITFLTSLQSSDEIYNILIKFTFVAVGREGEQIKMGPNGILVESRTALENIQQAILCCRSKVSIESQRKTMSTQLTRLIQKEFYFAVRVMSSKEFRLAHFSFKPLPDAAVLKKLSPLVSFHYHLSDVLHYSSHVMPWHLDGSSETDVISILDAKIAATMSIGHTLNGDSSDVYAGLKEQVPIYLWHCELLIMLSKLQSGMPYFKQLLGAGGDLLAIAMLPEDINLLLGMMSAIFDQLSAGRKELMTHGKKQNDALIESKQTNEWMRNYRNLLRTTVSVGSSQDIKKISDSITIIKRIIQTWRDSPQDKLREFYETLARFRTLLGGVSQGLVMFDPKYAEYDHAFKALASLSGRSLFPSSSGAEEANAPYQKSRIIKKIINALITYSKDYGYKFALPEVEDAIRYAIPSADSSTRLLPELSHWQTTNKSYCNDKHQARAQWIYNTLKLLYSKQTEEIILNEFLDRIVTIHPIEGDSHVMLTTGKSAFEMKRMLDPLEREVGRAAALRALSSAIAADRRESPGGAGAGTGCRIKETEPTYSGMVAELKELVDYCTVSADKAGRQKDFLDNHWNPLCFLEHRRASKVLHEHHSRLRDIHTLTGADAFWNDLHRSIERDPAPKWSLTVSTLLKKEGTPIPRGTHTESGEPEVDKEFALSWVLDKRKDTTTALAAAITAADNRCPTYKTSQDDLFRRLSLRVLQKQSSDTKRDSDLSMEEKRQFDKYLEEIFRRHQNTRDIGNRAFYLTIASGLMVLGANPRDWMNSQASNKQEVGLVGKEEAELYFLAAQQTDLILSHLRYRAKRLGDCVLFFGSQLDALFDAFSGFAAKLSHSVEKDNNLLWKMLKALGHERERRDARYHRATVLWMGLRHIYMLVSDNLFQAQRDGGVKKSADFQRACEQLTFAIDGHIGAVSTRSKLYNTGITTARELRGSIASVDRELTGVFAMRRVLQETVEREELAQATVQAAVEVIGEKDRIIGEKDKEVAEKDKAMDEQNRITKRVISELTATQISNLQRQFTKIINHKDFSRWTPKELRERVEKVRAKFYVFFASATDADMITSAQQAIEHMALIEGIDRIRDCLFPSTTLSNDADRLTRHGVFAASAAAPAARSAPAPTPTLGGRK